MKEEIQEIGKATEASVSEILGADIASSDITQYIIAFGIFVVAFAGLYIAKKFIIGRLHAVLAGKTIVYADYALKAIKDKTRFLFMLVVSAFIASNYLELGAGASKAVFTVFLFAVLLQIGLWLNSMLMDWIAAYKAKKSADNPAATTGMGIIKFLAQMVLWSGVALLFLDNMGFDVTALAAGLGVGGIAVALAAQNILSDLFASLTILFDKPFTNGDFIIIGDQLGSVESIGMKTTRVRSLSGEQIVFSNNDLLSSRIRNFGRMKERRVVFTVGITYDASIEQIKSVPKIIKEAVESQENTRFDRSHFKNHGDFSLDFETVYYVNSPDYNMYMDIQQEINLILHERFIKEGIDFAFPTRTIHVNDTAKSDIKSVA